MFSSWFSRDFEDGTLVNDLAQELACRGHQVLVYAQDWAGRTDRAEIIEGGGVTVAWQPVKKTSLPGVRMPWKWGATSFDGWRRFGSTIRAFDPQWIVGFTPTTIHAGLIRRLLPSRRIRSLIIQWDFFPFHHAQIGMIRSRLLARMLERVETSLIDRFDHIGHMTPRNTEYFNRHYAAARKVNRLVIPIWGPASRTQQGIEIDCRAIREKYALPHDKVIAVFGGQLSKGRGIDNVLVLAERCARELPEAYFVIIGDGELRAYIEARIKAMPSANMVLKKRLPRSEYQGFVRCCDIGIVSTEGQVDVPTYPSKSIDYFRNSVPVIASMEASTDYCIILERDANAGLASVAGDHDAFFVNMARLTADADLRRRLGESGRAYFLETLTVSKVAEAIERCLAAA